MNKAFTKEEWFLFCKGVNIAELRAYRRKHGRESALNHFNLAGFDSRGFTKFAREVAKGLKD